MKKEPGTIKGVLMVGVAVITLPLCFIVYLLAVVWHILKDTAQQAEEDCQYMDRE